MKYEEMSVGGLYSPLKRFIIDSVPECNIINYYLHEHDVLLLLSVNPICKQSYYCYCEWLHKNNKIRTALHKNEIQYWLKKL